MKNKGFTLVELLAILGLLAVITLITIPAVDGIIKKNKKKMYEEQIETIRNGLKTWGDANVEMLPEESGDILTLNLGYLKAQGFVKPDMVNVLNEMCFPNDMSVSIKKVNENYEYIVDSGSGSEPTVRDCSPGVLLYRDNTLKGADPVLDDGLIPVIYDGTSVKVAALDSEWYSYSDKLWANAVAVKKSTRNTYLNAIAGTVINESDILAYFVWIPRYKYKISTGGTTTPSSIDIVFETKDTNESKGDAINEYRTHPAFKFGNKKLNGIWVGKFETTGTSETPTIKPNLAALINQSVYTQFSQALNFKSDKYGITTDSHMMKLSEHGAVKYLSHSKYGINTNIRLNNNSNRLTGCGASTDFAAESTSCEIAFGNSSLNYPQSSTGNIYGIFDLSGGVDDRLMAIYKERYTTESEFTSLPASKYYDTITSSTYSEGCDGTTCYGFGLTETYGWYSQDIECQVDSSDPFVTKGNSFDDSTTSSIFHTSCSSGRSNNDAYRVVIVEG